MVDFKPIDEFTFDDCVKSLGRCKSESVSPNEELLHRYNELLRDLKAKEKRDYPSVKTIDGLERYIKKYSNLKGATKYHPEHFDTAQKELKILKRKQIIKKRFKVLFSVILLIGIIGSIVYVGYKPVSYFYISESTIKFSKSAESKAIRLSTNAPDIYIDEYVDWFDASQEGDSIVVTAGRNNDDLRKSEFYVKAYPTFFGERLGFLEESIRINVEQQDGHASYINVNQGNLYFDADGGNESLYVTTDGIEWDIDTPEEGWLSVSRDGSNVEIKVYKNTTTSDRTASFRVYADNQEKYVYVNQDVYAKDAGITEISMNEGTGNVDMKLRIDYYTQGYGDEEFYVFLKIYSDKTGNVWYRSYERIYPTQSQSESYRTFTVRASTWHGKYGENTIYACISRYTDGSSPICSFEQGFNVRSNR